MKLLLDTHVALWSFAEPERLSALAREAIVNRDNLVFLSAASTWEIAIKYAQGKLQLPSAPENLLPMQVARAGLSFLPIDFEHTLAAAQLPPHHRDPFDRMLIAQALVENLMLMTVDPKMAMYDVQRFQ